MIREERDDFVLNEIEVVPGYNFSQYNTVKKIHLYHNSHFESGDYEVINGVTRKRIFHNIGTWRCEVATKMIDLDTKDFILVTSNPEDDLAVFLLEKELKLWLKKHKLGKTLNQIVEELPVYGTVVLEKVNGGVQIVDLRNLYIDQGAETLESASYINIKHIMTPGELRKMNGKWDNVDDAIALFSKKTRPSYDPLTGTTLEVAAGRPTVDVWVRYGEVPKSFFTKKESDEDVWTLAKFVVAGIDHITKNPEGVIIGEEGLVLYSEEIDSLPLKAFHYTRTKGRFLGVGIIEKTFEEQRRINEIKNQKSKAMEIAALTVFQSRGESVANNITTDTENGQILFSKERIEPVPTEARDMIAFENEEKNVEAQADRLTFSYDVVRGESTPATATLGAVQLQNQQATSSFEYKRENIELILREYIEDIVYPELKKELNKEHVLRFTGSIGEINKMRDIISTSLARREQYTAMVEGREVKTEEELKAQYTKELQRYGDKVWLKIIDDFYKDIDWKVDLVIMGENMNLIAEMQNRINLLQFTAKDPTIWSDPIKRHIIFSALSRTGTRTAELDAIQREAQASPQLPPGATSAPGAPQGAMVGMTPPLQNAGLVV